MTVVPISYDLTDMTSHDEYPACPWRLIAPEMHLGAVPNARMITVPSMDGLLA